MNKKVLVVSDNPKLTEFLKNEIISKLDWVECDFCYSSINTNPQSMENLGAEKLNIKTQDEKFAKRYDVIFSLHCKQIFPAVIVNNAICVNVHPGLNPYNRGWFPQVFSIINNLPAGATIHLMNEDVDAGDIIVQEEVSINDFDTSLDVYEKVQNIEMKLLLNWFEKIVLNEFDRKQPQSLGNYNSIGDFNELCKLDLQHVGTLKEHLDMLRALTHGNFRNAHISDIDGTKVFIKIEFLK